MSGATVQERLTGIFRRYGLPRKMLLDNGSPGGLDAAHPYTPFSVWLLRLGVQVGHSGPYHSQTLGKDEKKCVLFVSPINPKSVTYVPERLLPISPV